MPPQDVPSGVAYPFFELSRKINRQTIKYRPLFRADFPQRSDVRHYFAARLSGDDMTHVYAHVAKTNFPSLYATTRPQTTSRSPSQVMRTRC